VAGAGSRPRDLDPSQRDVLLQVSPAPPRNAGRPHLLWPLGPAAIGLGHPLCRPQPEDTRIVRITQNMIPESLHQSVNARLVMLGVMEF
jgi:hypothetical protein